MTLDSDLETRIVLQGPVPPNFRVAFFDELKHGMTAYYRTFETYREPEGMRREDVLIAGVLQEIEGADLRSDKIFFKFLAPVRNEASVPGTITFREGDYQKAWYLNGKLYVRT